MTSVGPVSRRNRPSKPALSREAIVDAAMELLAAQGLEAVSMRRVAQLLDTGPASLYVYVQNRDELLGLILDRVAGDIELPEPGPGTQWREDLTGLIDDCIARLARHRGLAALTASTIPIGPNAMAITNALLRLLAESGMERRARAWAVDLIALYISAASGEEAERGGAVEETDRMFVDVHNAISSVPVELYPHVHDLREEMTSGSEAERRRWMIEVLINGVLATAAPRS